MGPEEVVAAVSAAGATLTLRADGNLSVRPASLLGDELLAALREHKHAIVALLASAGQATAPEQPPDRSYGAEVRWARELGWLSVRDPETGEAHEVRAKEAPPGWARQAAAAKNGTERRCAACGRWLHGQELAWGRCTGYTPAGWR